MERRAWDLVLTRTRVASVGWLIAKQQEVTLLMTCSKWTAVSLSREA